MRLQRIIQGKKKVIQEPPVVAVAASRKRVLYIVGTVKSGGTLRYSNDLTRIAGGAAVVVDNIRKLNACLRGARPGDIVAIQQIFRPCGITADVLNRFLARLPAGCRVFATVHDNYYTSGVLDAVDEALYDPVEPYHDPRPFPHPRVNDVLCPSHYIYKYFCKFFYHPSIHVVPHPDKVRLPPLSVPPVCGTIRLGIITSIQRCKGSEYFDTLFDDPPPGVEFYVYADYEARPNVVARGAYDEDDIYDKLEADGVHGLLFFNKWPESYCYALSKGINTGLPIYYTPIGAVEERLSAYQDDRFHACPKIQGFLDYIQEKQGTNHPQAHDPRAVPEHVPDFYRHLFAAD